MADVKIANLVESTAPTDTNIMIIEDASDTKKITFANIKATLKTYFDTLYNNYVHPTSDGSLHVPANSTTNNNRILKASGTAGSYTWSDIGVVANDLTAKATPVDADGLMVVDSAASNVGKKTTIAQFKAILKTYFDTLYNNYVHPTSDGSLHVPANSTTNNNKLLRASATAGVYTWHDIGTTVDATPAKSTPLDADSILVVDSTASNVGKKTTIAQFKAILKTYFDTLYGIKPTNQATATSGQILTSNGGGTATYVDFSGGGQLLGTASIKAISYNAQIVAENITIPSTYNAMSVGDITIADGFTVTIENGAVWRVV